jgi:hypothetical protein
MDVKQVADTTRERPKQDIFESVVKEIRKQFSPEQSASG